MSKTPPPPSSATLLLRRRIGLHVTWSVVMLAFAWRSGALHDYVAYMKQWRLVLEGGAPWSTDNAYGPLHLVLAPLTQIGRYAPKLLMGAMFAFATGLLLVRLTKVRNDDRNVIALFLVAITCNPLVWGIGFHYGLNDTLAAALILFAVLVRLDGRHMAAGVLLALAALLKFYPLALVPFFMLEGRTLRLRGGLAALAVFALGMAVACAIYGADALAPILFGAERGPKLLSILNALNAADLTGWAREAVSLLIGWNSVLVLATVGALFAVFWSRGTSWLEASVLGLLAMLLVYKTGHQQFYMSWVVLVAALPLLNTPNSDRLARLCLPMLVFIALFHLGYAMTDRWQMVQPVRDLVGYVAFPLGAVTIWLGLTTTRSRRAEPLRTRL